jgi:hypothetical protein
VVIVEKDGKIQDLVNEIEILKERGVNTYNDSKGWLNRGNKWAFAAVPIIILGTWLFFMYQYSGNLQDTIAQKNARITELENRKAQLTPGADEQRMRNEPTPDTTASKKKI